MGIMVYSLLWVMQDFVHQPYVRDQMVRKSVQSANDDAIL